MTFSPRTFWNSFDWASGVRMTAAAVVPVLLGQSFGALEAGAIGSLGALLVSITDQGGPFPHKAAAMTIAAVLVAASGAIATGVGSLPLVGVLLMFLIAFGAGMVGVFGNTSSTVGFVILIAFVLLLPLPGTWEHAGERAVVMLAGGAWALLLSLWLWPIRPFFPVLRLIAAAYRSVAVLAEAPASRNTEGWTTALTPERTAALEAIAKARDALMTLRSSRQGASPTGQRSLVLIRTADRLYAAVAVFRELLAQVKSQPERAALQPRFEEALRRIAEACRAIGDGIDRGGGSVDVRDLDEWLSLLEQDLSQTSAVPPALARNLDRVVATIRRQMETAAERARNLGYARGEDSVETFDADQQASGNDRVQQLRDNLSPSSLTLRHSLRLGIALAATVGIYHFWNIPRGAWITLTVAVILKPDFSGTRQRAFERVAGTLAGAVAAAVLLSAAKPGPLTQALMLTISGVLTFAQMHLSYRRFVAFLTIFVILLVESVHPGEPGVIYVRLFNTLLGGVLALIAGYVLWPKWAAGEIPQQIAKALAANRDYLLAVLGAYGQSASAGGLRRLREKAQIENSNAAVSFQRVLGESWGKNRFLEPYYSLVNSNQRIFDTCVALSTHAQHVRIPQIAPLAAAFGTALEELEQAARQERLPVLATGALEEEFDALASLHSTEMAGIGMLIGRLVDEVRGAGRALARVPRPLVLPKIHQREAEALTK